MPWRLTPPGAPPPLIDCGPDHPDTQVALPAVVSEFFAVDDQRGALREIDGMLCARVVAGGARGQDQVGLERLDLALIAEGVVLRRRAVEDMPHQPFDLDRLRADWEQVLPEQRDSSVLFAAILNQVIDGYGQVLDVIRTRADEQEGHLLDRDRPLREIQIALLEQTGALGAIRRHIMPLRNDLRELRELRDPVARQVVSGHGARWLSSVEDDLRADLPEALGTADARIGSTLGQLQGERSEVTNRVVLALTILTGAFYIPTVLTGLYGMNVPLPFQHDKAVFWLVVGLAMALFVSGAALIAHYGLWRVLRRDALQGLRPTAGRRARAAPEAFGPPHPPE